MIDIRIGGDLVGWKFPSEVSEISLSDYLKYCQVCEERMPDWFKKLRGVVDVVEREEIYKELDGSVDMKVELLEYWSEVICVFAKPIGKTPELTKEFMRGMSMEVEGMGKVKFELGIDDVRGLWDVIDGGDNMFIQYQKELLKDEDYYKKKEKLLFRYDENVWGCDTPYMRGSKLVEYIEGKFWAEVLNDSNKGMFGKALGKLVAVLVRKWSSNDIEDVDGYLEEVLVGNFTEENVMSKERYFGDLGMDVVMKVGFFLLSRADSLNRGLGMHIESLRVLKGLVELIR